MKKPISPRRFDPTVPLTWPLRWYFYQAWGRSEEGISDPFCWHVERIMPDFGCEDLVTVYRLGLHAPRSRVASGYARTIEEAKVAIEAALHEVNLELERHYLTPRIVAYGYTAGTAGSFSGDYVPTPGGRQ